MPERAISCAVEALARDSIELTGVAPILRWSEVRPGDQPLYISDTAKLSAADRLEVARRLARRNLCRPSMTFLERHNRDAASQRSARRCTPLLNRTWRVSRSGKNLVTVRGWLEVRAGQPHSGAFEGSTYFGCAEAALSRLNCCPRARCCVLPGHEVLLD